VALVAEHNENVSTHLPMVSRVLHLLLIDILIVGLEMRAAVSSHNELSDTDCPKNALDQHADIRLALPAKPAISHSQ